MTIIKLSTNDQLLTATAKPTVASGDIDTVQLQVTFDPQWDGFTRSAVFYTQKNPNTKVEVFLTDDACLIPSQVMTDAGTLFIGVRGCDINGDVKTSSLVKYKIIEGAANDGEAAQPSPTLYQEVIQKYNEVAAVADNAVEISNSAVETAENAVDIANNAVEIAESAVETANKAVEDAGRIADSVIGIANEANATAQAANEAATAAQEAAEEAVDTAEEAKTAALAAASKEFVKDAIAEAETQKIGDILYTERVPDLDMFVECNGASLSVNDYSELYAVVGKKYGHTGDVPYAWSSNISTSYMTRPPLFMPNGTLSFEYSEDNQTWHRVYDEAGTLLASYRTGVSDGQRNIWFEASNYPNTQVVMPNGDVIGARLNAGKLMRVTNIQDVSKASYTDISGFSFKTYSNTYMTWNCSTQIVHDGNGTYYILTPTYSPSSDEDGSTYWNEYYNLHSTTDFVTFTQIVSAFASDYQQALKLVAVNGKIFLLPNSNANSGGGYVYMLVNGSFVRQTGMRYFQDLVYVNGHYYGAYNYNWDDQTVAGLYVAGEDLVFTQLYSNATWGNTFYGTSVNTYSGSWEARLASLPETNEIAIMSSYYWGSSSRRLDVSVFKVNDDGTLTKTNNIFHYSEDSSYAYIGSWIVANGDTIAFQRRYSLYFCQTYPTHFSIPSRYKAHGASSTTQNLTDNPTPYIKAKDKA